MTACDVSSPFDFSGRRVLVTGGSRGIGAAIAAQFAARGAHVCINYSRDDAAAGATRDAIAAAGGHVTISKANLVHREEIRACVERFAEDGGIDAVVHNAAIGSFKPLMQVRENQWDLSMAVNARALLTIAQTAAPLMPAGSAIVSLSSLGSTRVVPEYGAIGASKAALESLTRSLAVELAPKGIRVNAVSAGLVDAPALDAHPHRESLARAAIERTPLARLATPAEIADVVLFLCSPLARWIVGQTIVADGGLSLGI